MCLYAVIYLNIAYRQSLQQTKSTDETKDVVDIHIYSIVVENHILPFLCIRREEEFVFTRMEQQLDQWRRKDVVAHLVRISTCAFLFDFLNPIEFLDDE